MCTFACLQFDGMQPNYFHFGCFFKNGNLPTSTADIEGFELLRLEDQKKIEDKLTKVCVHVCMCMCVCVHVCVCVCVCVCVRLNCATATAAAVKTGCNVQSATLHGSDTASLLVFEHDS